MAVNYPKVAYFGNVPVEAGLHGSALLYRLFSRYPPDRLLIIEGNRCSRVKLRLKDVAYRNLEAVFPTHCRFGTARFFLHLPAYQRTILNSVRHFQPEAIVSVAQGNEWLPAFLAARKARLPFYLIVHDGGRYSRTVTGRTWLNCIDKWLFQWVYRSSQGRFCVSPYMEAEYRERYGVPGHVLLPSVGCDCPEFSAPRESLASNPSTLRLAFAGSIGMYITDLLEVAECLHEVGGELVVYGGTEDDYAELSHSQYQNVRLMPTLTEVELVRSLHAEADAAFLPMSFVDAHQENRRISFPSKLTAYCAAGLPVLVRGPVDCSAIRWARENPGFALLVTDASSKPLTDQLRQLASNGALRIALSKNSLEICSKYFRASIAQGIFYDAILEQTPDSVTTA